MCSTMTEIKDVLANDCTSEIVDYLQEENKTQAERDNQFMSLITKLFSSQQPYAANTSAYYPPQYALGQPSKSSSYLFSQQIQPGSSVSFASFQSEN